MLKSFFLILCCLFSSNLFAQQADTKALAHTVADFDKALTGRDTTALKWLLNEKLSYGHSNGWVQTKKDMISDLYNGKLSYEQIKADVPEVETDGDIASVRMTADVVVLMSGSKLPFRLKILQVWKWEHTHWVLFARQSVKV